jgi:putative membrane protein insertion efficiency factor
MNRLAVAALRATIRAYQLSLSPFLGGNCRFAPTCSEYARDAIARHGALGGLALAVRRLARCHPFGPGGFDPVPDRIPTTPFAGPRRVVSDATDRELARRPA